MKLSKKQLNMVKKDRNLGKLLTKEKKKSHWLTFLVLALLVYLVFMKVNIFMLLALLLLLILLMRR